jgi:hypothetical protein
VCVPALPESPTAAFTGHQAAAQRTGRVLSRREVELMQSLPIPDLLSHVLDEQALADAMEAMAGDEPSAAEGDAWADPDSVVLIE